MATDNQWTPPHSHEPNPTPPTNDPGITIYFQGFSVSIHPQHLLTLTQRSVDDCYIISTGHGASGPFKFGGVSLLDIVDQFVARPWSIVEILSADAFRTRISRDELERTGARPALLALSKDGKPLSRDEGLVRLIVPHEEGTALQQVKWISEIRIFE